MLKTAESVTPRHPDKLCDRISDAILTACLKQDDRSRVAIETMGGHGIITITGELTTNAYVDMRQIAQDVAGEQYGVQTNVVRQSPEIAQGVDTGGAGDQGVMVGYATSETSELMPQEVMLARSLCQTIYEKFPFDGKTQVTVDENGIIRTVVVSFQNAKQEELTEIISEWLNGRDVYKIFVNPCGDWIMGGFEADTGLTGRKLAIDNYGTNIPIGGGCFSGKDPTKVDRSAAYMARKIAVDYLTANDAQEVFCHLAYSIGVAEPVMAVVTIDGVQETVGKQYDLTPQGIIDCLSLRSQDYNRTAEWGHFGNGFLWDKAA